MPVSIFKAFAILTYSPPTKKPSCSLTSDCVNFDKSLALII